MLLRLVTWFVAVTLGLAMFFQYGCAGRSKPSRFYILSAEADTRPQAQQKTGNTNAVVIGISPIGLPKYLKKQEIVTRTAANELHLAEYDRWAGKIEEDIGRVIAQDLDAVLESDIVLVTPALIEISPDYDIRIEILRFDGRLGGEVDLVCLWAVVNRQDNMVYGFKMSHITETVKGAAYVDFVAAQSRVLAAFSRELAGAVTKLKSN